MCAALHYAKLQQSPDKCKPTGAEDIYETAAAGIV